MNFKRYIFPNNGYWIIVYPIFLVVFAVVIYSVLFSQNVHVFLVQTVGATENIWRDYNRFNSGVIFNGNNKVARDFICPVTIDSIDAIVSVFQEEVNGVGGINFQKLENTINFTYDKHIQGGDVFWNRTSSGEGSIGQFKDIKICPFVGVDARKKHINGVSINEFLCFNVFSPIDAFANIGVNSNCQRLIFVNQYNSSSVYSRSKKAENNKINYIRIRYFLNRPTSMTIVSKDGSEIHDVNSVKIDVSSDSKNWINLLGPLSY